MPSVSIKFDDTALQAKLNALQEKLQEAVRPSAQAGAQVFYDEVKSNVAALGTKTGNLNKSIYQVFAERFSGAAYATYYVSWNRKKAQHGHLVEYGHIQRYKAYIGSDGNWYTAVRAGMRGQPAPNRKAPQSVKDAYYVPLSSPRQIAAQAFIRPAYESKKRTALKASKAKFLELAKGAINGA